MAIREAVLALARLIREPAAPRLALLDAPMRKTIVGDVVREIKLSSTVVLYRRCMAAIALMMKERKSSQDARRACNSHHI
jgi:hypothetical protein